MSCIPDLCVVLSMYKHVGYSHKNTFFSGDKIYWMSLTNNSGEWTWDAMPKNTDLLGSRTQDYVSPDRPHTCGLLNETHWHVRCCTESEFYICEKGMSPFGVDLVSHKMHLQNACFLVTTKHYKECKTSDRQINL